MPSKMNRRWLLVGLAMVVGLAAPATATAGSTLRVQAPKSTVSGAGYSISTKGRALGNANFLRSTQVPDQPCKKTWKAESGIAASMAPSGRVHGSFSREAFYSSGNPPGHTWYVCAYLINKKSRKTFARASAHFAAT